MGKHIGVICALEVVCTGKLSEKGTLPFQINCSWQSNTGIHSSLSLLCWWLSLSVCNMPHIQIKILVLMLQCSVLSIDLNINMILTHANQVHVCAVLAASAVGLLVLPWWNMCPWTETVTFYQKKYHKRTLCSDPHWHVWVVSLCWLIVLAIHFPPPFLII